MTENKKEQVRELTGIVTCVGTKVTDTMVTMFIEIDNKRINFNEGMKVKITVL